LALPVVRLTQLQLQPHTRKICPGSDPTRILGWCNSGQGHSCVATQLRNRRTLDLRHHPYRPLCRWYECHWVPAERRGI